MKWQGIKRGSIDIGKDAGEGLLAINTRFKVAGELRRRRGLARTSIQRKNAGVTTINGFSAFQSNVMAALTDGDRIQGYQQPYSAWGDNPDYTPFSGTEDLYAAAYGGQSYGVTGVTATAYTPSFQTGGVYIASMSYAAPYWYAASTNGKVYISEDAIAWDELTTGILSPGRMSALGPVIAVTDFTTGVKVSVDYGATWESHVPYTNATKTFQAVYIKEISPGKFRIFVGGQAGTGYGSGILRYADSDSMPVPGDAWTSSYTSATAATVYSIADGHNDGLCLATTLNPGNIGLGYSSDNGASWSVTDTGVAATNGRCAMWSDTLNVYCIGTTAGGATGSLYSANSSFGAVTLLWNNFGGALDSFTDTRGRMYCAANAGGLWTFDLSTHTKLASGTMQYIGGKGETT